MTVRKAPLMLLVLLVGCGPGSCQDMTAAKDAKDAVQKVAKLQELVDGLERRLTNLEALAKAEYGPSTEELGRVMADIDATGKTPGVFIANYVFLNADKEGNGVWRLIFGQKDGAGRRIQTRVRKTATGWTWIQGELVLIQ